MEDKVVSFLIKHCAKVGEPLTDIGVLDLYDSGSMKLSQMRKEIQKSWSDIQFEFLEKQKFPIGRGNEEMKQLKTIVRRSQDKEESDYSIIDILVKNEENSSLGTQKKMKDTHDRELLLIESNKNKERIKQTLKALQEFCKKTSLISQQNNEEYKKEVSDLQASLLKNDIKISFSTNLEKELQTARDILNSKIREQDEIIEHFSKIQTVNIKEMLAKNEATLMRSYYKGKIVHYHVSNIEACTFEYAQIGNDARQSQCTFVSQDQHQILQSKIDKEKKRYAASLGVEYIWARIDAGFEVGSSKGSSSSKEAEEKYESSTSQKTMVYIGESLSFSLDSIKLKSEIVNEFVQLYNSFTQIKKASEKEGEAQRKRNIFKKKVIEYFQLYGDQIELGAYSFGSTYEADSTLNFQGKVSKSQIKTEAAKCLNVNIRGGVTFSSIINVGGVGGSFEMNNNSSKKQKNSEGSQSISYSCSSNFKAFPNIKNCEKWSSIVAKNRSFWKVVKADLQLVKLIKIIKSHQNRPSFYNDDDSDVHNFEQQIEDILDEEQSGVKSAFRDEKTGKWRSMANECKNQDFLSSSDGKTIRIKHEILFYTQCLPKNVRLHKKVFKIESGLACLGLIFYNNSSELETKTSTQIKFTDVNKLKTSLQIEGGQFLFINAYTNDEVSFLVNFENEEVDISIKGEKKEKNYKPKLMFGGRFVCVGAYELEEAAVIKEIW